MAGKAILLDASTGQTIRTFLSPNACRSCKFGESVAFISDVDRDAQEDIAIGELNTNHVYIFSASSGTLIHSVTPPVSSRYEFGKSMAYFSCPTCDPPGALIVGEGGSPGCVYIIDPEDGSILRTLQSPNLGSSGRSDEGDGYGASVSSAPDLNGDGCPDFIVGAPGETVATGPRLAGRVYLYDGASGQLLKTLVSLNERYLGSFGESVSGIPDVNSDGLGDLVVGAPGEDAVYIFQSPFEPDPDLVVEPPSLQFGEWDVDDGPVEMSVVLKNVGEGPLDFRSDGIRLEGVAVDQFALVDTGPVSTLLPGSTRELWVRFDPAVAAGVWGSILLQTNDPVHPATSVSLSGTGVRNDTLPRVIHVRPDAAGGGDGKSWETAYGSIWVAHGSALGGDSVWVASGTYEETVQLLSGVNLYGGFSGWEGEDQFQLRDWKKNETVLRSTSYDNPVVTVSDDSLIDGFTITGGRGEYGGGVRCSNTSNVTIQNCKISGNGFLPEPPDHLGGLGGGLYSYDSTVQLVNCEVSENIAYRGAGICGNDSTIYLANCLISSNSGEHGYFAYPYFPGSGPGISWYYKPGRTWGGAFSLYHSTLLAENVTIANNLAEGGSVSYLDGEASIETVNSIVWNNGTESPVYGDGFEARFSAVEGGSPGEGNTDSDPLFKDPENGDYRLRYGSPCIDSGTITDLSTDLDGNMRPVDIAGVGVEGPNAYDMGAYEYSGLHAPDLNDSGSVDFLDLCLFQDEWHAQTPASSPGNLVDNSAVDALDLLILLADWQRETGL